MKNLLVHVLVISMWNCTKKVGKDPLLAYGDKGLFDSCRSVRNVYYRDTLYSGNAGPHGPFKLKFNSIARSALGLDGKLPKGAKFPEGSHIIKEVYKNGNPDLYAFMYKRTGAWLWAEIRTNGEVIYSVQKDPATCLGCHTAQAGRDHALSFDRY